MSSSFQNTPADQKYIDDINRRITLRGQITSHAMLEHDMLDKLYLTVDSQGSIYNPTSNEHAVGWLQLNATFKLFKGQPEYRTLKKKFATVGTERYSVHYRVADEVKSTFSGSADWAALSAEVGEGDAASQRQTLTNLMATANTLPTHDGQNLLDTDHPGLRYDAASKLYVELTQSNWAPGTTFNDVGLGAAVEAMTGYHDESGKHYGNVYAENSDLPTTNDIRTQAAKPPQFHVYAGSTAIKNVKTLARTMNTTSEYAGAFSYSKIDELPPKSWRILWLNVRAAPGVALEFKSPFLRKYDGMTINVATDGQHLDNQRFQMSEINAHAGHGFDSLGWSRFYGGEEP